MRALTWQAKRTVSVETVPDPHIEHPTDAVIRVASTAICGSDLHLYLPLEEAPQAYERSQQAADGCIKVVLRP